MQWGIYLVRSGGGTQNGDVDAMVFEAVNILTLNNNYFILKYA